MFRIELILTADDIDGLDALDFCRTKGLPDKEHVYTRQGVTAKCDVDEAFARLWFSSTDTCYESVNITCDMLVPGDLAFNQHNYLVFADLSDQRARDLFIAAKFREAKAK
jgi:hypothetical protein